MAAKQAPAKNENEGESDEDSEVYFLKPVNEYNIVDKIKEANKELFATGELLIPQQQQTVTTTQATDFSDAIGNLIGGNSIDKTVITSTTANRKVTFALNLEDYEPTTTTTSNSSTGCDQIVTEGGELSESADTTIADELAAKLLLDFKFSVIDEEDESRETDRGEASLIDTPGNDEEEIVEEINTDTESVVEVQSSKPEIVTVQSIHRRRHTIIKQDTFVYDDGDGDGDDVTTAEEIQNKEIIGSDVDEQTIKNKNPSNLLSIPNCVDDQYQRYDMDSDYNDEDDDDDDDKLSIIVASYISDNDDDNKNNNNIRTKTLLCNSNKGNSSEKSRRILPFGKRFSLRRKLNNSNTIGTCGSGSVGFSRNNRNSSASSPSSYRVGELKLNYKTCCEHRHSLEAKQLPKYTGYLSEYGLSREQLEHRQDLRERQQRSLIDSTLKANEEEMRKMQDNEKAFCTWLKNKMRFPVNKTRNMFDVKSKARNIFGDKTREQRNMLHVSKTRNLFDVKLAIGCTSLTGVAVGGRVPSHT